MAGGNLGELSMKLTLQSRIEDETQKIIKALNNVDASGKQAQRALELIRKAVRDIDNKSAISSLNRFSNIASSFAINSEKDFAKLLTGFENVRSIIGQMKTDGVTGVTIFANGVSKSANDAENALRKLSSLIDKVSSTHGEGLNVFGVDATNNIRQALAQLMHYKTELAQISANGGIHPITGQVAGDVTKSAAYQKTIDDAKRAYKELGDALKSYSDERKRQQEAERREREAELKAMDSYAKRYMELQEAKAKADAKAAADAKKASEQRTAQVERDTRKMSELYSILGVARDKAEKVGMNSLALNVDTSKLEAKLKVAEDLMNRIFNTNPKTLGLGGRASAADLTTETKNVKRALDEAAMSQKELNREQEKANREAAAQKKREEAQALRDAAKAAREQAQAEKQRQREIEISKQRIQSLEKALNNLREKRYTAKMLGFDTSEADAKIGHLRNQLADLRDILADLNTRGVKAIGQIGNRGNGREVQSANDLAASYDKANREAAKGIEIERKRQQEIAASAAKARNDLASAFSGANKEAQKMASVMSDIKSLFLQGGIVFGAQQLFNSIVQTGGEIVQQHIALRSILGDVQKADELFAQTQQLALQSPFKFGELNRDVKQLAAFGVEADDLYDTTKRLADIASGLGVSFERLGLAYGQVKARSWLDGKELRQFAYAGLPLLQKITELYNQEGKNGKKNYTASEVKGMITKREVSFEDVQKVLWQMTDEGGQFYNMQFVLSDTLLGRWNKLIDAWDIMLGKFADGKNVVGGVFTFAIDRVTDLVLALDKLSPVALSVGALFAGKKMFSAVSSKMGIGSLAKNYTTELNAQLKSYAIEQQKLVVEGKITQQKALQNVQARAYLLADDVSRANAMSRLALEGKMSVLQMQKAVKEGLVSKELIRQLAVMGAITAKQEQIILGGGRIAATWNMIGTKVKTAFAAIGGWWTVGIGAIIGLWTTISGEMDAIKEKADSLRDPNSERMKPYYDILAQDKGTTDTELKKQIESMKELLVKSDAFTKSIEAQISKAKSLNEQYDILKQGVDKAKNVAAGDADLIAGAIGNSGGFVHTGNPWNDTVTENVQDMQKSMAAYQVMIASMDDNTKKHLGNIADAYLSAGDRTKTLEDKIRILADKGGAAWQWFGMKVNKWNQSVGLSIAGLGLAANKATRDVDEIVNDDIPRIISYLQKKTGRFGDDFKKLCQEQPDRFRTMLEEILGSANLLVPEIAKKLKELTGLSFNSDKGGVEDTPLNSIQRRVFANLGFNKKQYDLLSPHLVDGSYYNTKNNVKTALQDLYNEYKSRQMGGATQQEVSAAKAAYDALWNVANKGLGYKYIPEDKKSNKVPKDTTKNKEEAAARKADQEELKALQARLKLIKDGYTMYKQYYDKLHDEVASAKIVAGKFNDQGLSNDDITKIMSEEGLRSLMEDYVTRVRNWHPRREEEMKDSKDSAIAEGVREMNDIDFRKMTEGMTDFSSSVDKSLSEMSRRWKAYQSLLKATGNTSLSATVSGLSYDRNAVYGKGFEGLFSDYLRNYISGISRHVGGLDANKLKGMSDEDIKKFLGSVFADSDPQKIDGLSTALKKLRDTLVDTEFQDAINAYVSLIGKAVDEASVAGRANGEYETTKTNLDNALSMGMIDKTAHEAALQIAKAIRDNEIMKSTAGYMALSSYANGMADNDFESAYNNALEVLKQQLDANVISAGQYASELKKLDDIQKKRAHSGIFGDTSSKSAFIQGGLPGLLGYYNNKADARRVYLKGQGLSAEEIENDEQVSKYSKLADNTSNLISDFGSLSTVISAVNGVFNGLQQATQSLADMFDALGNEGLANFFSDTSDAISAVGSVFSPIGDLAKSAMSGDIGGVISGAISSPIKIFTSPITAFAKLHDKKLDRQIQELERANKNIESVRNSIDRNLQNTLGGVYAYKSKQKDANSTGTFEYYDQMYASYEQQLANLQSKRDKEDRKKKTDKDALADYDSQIDELSDKITTLAKDMANSLYGIDVKSWASELTSTLVDAWASGENAAEAYADKVKDIMKSVAKSMLSQMYVEQYFKPLEELIEKRMEERHGKLLPEDISEFAQSLMDASSSATDAIKQTLDALKDSGLDLTDSESSSMSSSIKGITESTADVLSSYINAVRADVSVIRQVQGLYLPKIDVTTQAQLQQLTMISENTLRNADAAVAIQASVSDMKDMLNRAQNNTKPFYVYVK